MIAEKSVSCLRRFRVLGLPVDGTDMERALQEIERLVSTATRPGYILAANPEKVYAVRSSAFLREFFEGASLLIPDGIGIVLALRWLFGCKVIRVPGADLMQRLCALAAERGYRIFIYGASEEVNAGAVRELECRYPGISIVGRANGYVKDTDHEALVGRINNSGADILFVGLGSPKQEEWIARWLPSLRVKVCQGIGGTLDTIVGRVKRAPKIFQVLGLEWFYRLLRQPSRAGRQWNLVRFAGELFVARVSGRREQIF